jgi:hypothetical protein
MLPILLDAGLGFELGDVVFPGVGARSDEPYTDRLVSHGATW